MASGNGGRRGSAPKFYRAVALALAGRMVQCGITMQECDESSGVQDGYTAKLLHPDTAQGRVAQWETIQLLIDTLFPHGVEVVLVPRAPGSYDPAAYPRPDKATVRALSDVAAGVAGQPANDHGAAEVGLASEQEHLRRRLKAHLTEGASRGRGAVGARTEGIASKIGISRWALYRFKAGVDLPNGAAVRLEDFLDKADGRACRPAKAIDDLRSELRAIVQENPAALGILAREAGLIPQVLSSFATGSRLSVEAAELVRRALLGAAGAAHDPSARPWPASATRRTRGITASAIIDRTANDDTPGSVLPVHDQGRPHVA